MTEEREEGEGGGRERTIVEEESARLSRLLAATVRVRKLAGREGSGGGGLTSSPSASWDMRRRRDLARGDVYDGAEDDGAGVGGGGGVAIDGGE